MNKILIIMFVCVTAFIVFNCEDKKINDTTPPTVMITYPVSGSSVSGQVVIVADANDNNEVDKVEFYIDGQLKSTDIESPWEYLWDSGIYADGEQHSLYAKAYDKEKNVGTSAIELVTVLPNEQVIDIDGNVYQTIYIGDQIWMVENLRVEHYRNGDSIPNVVDATEWISFSTGAFCNYNNDDTIADSYGSLYNWYAVADNRNIAPDGWHVPTDAEWQSLVNYLGGENVAGGKMKEAGTTHWDSPNAGASNESGFTALPGGFRYNTGNFGGRGGNGGFWSATTTEYSSFNAWYRSLYYNDSELSRGSYNKRGGFSIRCVRD